MPDDKTAGRCAEDTTFYDLMMMMTTMTMITMTNLEVIIVDWKGLFHGGSFELRWTRRR